MNFIDNRGNIFPLTSYNKYPMGYEYEMLDYSFWLEPEKLSINLYYAKPVRFLLEKTNNIIYDIIIENDSSIYKLVGNITDNEDITDKLSNKLLYNDLNIVEITDNNKEYILVTFYILGKSSNDGIFTNNILITLKENVIQNNVIIGDSTYTYTPISISGNFYNTNEILYINGKNTGIELPSDIIKSIYSSNLYEKNLDSELYNKKLKELLLNYMSIFGSCGNYKSSINALDWFGWGNKITISKLLKTDNEFQSQYINDYFDLSNDILTSFKNFRATTYISLKIKENELTGKTDGFNFNNIFWNEDTPLTENLFNKEIINKIDNINYISKYYDFTFNELAIKLACLSYFYKKYFLPIHLNILSSSLVRQVYTNDLKYIIKPDTSFSDNTLMKDIYSNVNFPKDKYIYIYKQHKYIDANLNSFLEYNKETPNIIDFNDICINIPIDFETKNPEITENIISETKKEILYTYYYKCSLIISGKNQEIYSSNFNFIQKKKVTEEIKTNIISGSTFTNIEKTEEWINKYNSFVFSPKVLINDNIKEWNNLDLTIDLNCNDIWYKYNFTSKLPEFYLEAGDLIYTYNKKQQKQIDTWKDYEGNKLPIFNFNMYDKNLISIYDFNFIKNISNITDNNFEKLIYKYNLKYNIPNIPKYYNRIYWCELQEYSEIEKTYKDIIFDKNDIENNNIYKYFFDIDGNEDPIFNTTYNFNEGINYFFNLYLMKYEVEINSVKKYKYYVVMIANKTNNYRLLDQKDYSSDELEIVTNNKIDSADKSTRKFKLFNIKNADVFLINRMNFVSKEGINHYKQDDIITLKISNVNDYPFNWSNQVRWECSLNGVEQNDVITSNANTAIISVPDGTNLNKDGYYNISTNFCFSELGNKNINQNIKVKVNKWN